MLMMIRVITSDVNKATSHKAKAKTKANAKD